MRRFILPGTKLRVSQMAFGTAYLHHLRDNASRERLIVAAAEAGVSHFDTSPYYGFGVAEFALSVLARLGRPATVATKVGLYAPGGADQSETMVRVRKVAGNVISVFSRSIADWSVARARASLEGSLRRLRRPSIDLLLLHEPDFQLLKSEEWLRWRENEGGRIGAIGVAGEPNKVLPFVQVSSPIAEVIQTRDSYNQNEAAPIRATGREPQITYGHLASQLARQDLRRALTGAITRSPNCVVLVSTRRAERVAALAQIVEEFGSMAIAPTEVDT